MKTKKISFRVTPEEAENLESVSKDLGMSKSELLRDLIFSKERKDVGMEPKRRIKRNRAKCLLCGDIIESQSRHDFVTCSCGNLSVDGGEWYLRRAYGNGRNSWLELSEYWED